MKKILAQKTKKTVIIVLADSLVIKILENEFQRRVSQVVFNKQIKVLCKLTGIEDLANGLKNKPKKEEMKL